jgi:F-type H+-transporting ATPase subunit b
VDFLAVAGGAAREAGRWAAATGAETGGLTINLFWVISSAATFILFLAIIWTFAFAPISTMLADRKARIEQGLADAEAARRERESSATDRAETIQQARHEAKEILDRAQKVAQETRDADIAATRTELDRMRVRAAAEIEAEKSRALADLRAEVADLALQAAGRVVGETMSDARQRRLVEEFLRESSVTGSNG